MAEWSDKEKYMRFRRMARSIARSLAPKFTEAEILDAPRYGGGAICPDCQMEYHDHPWIEDGPAKGLTVTCQGKLVKL